MDKAKQEEVLNMIQQRREKEPEFRAKYDAFLAKRGINGKISDQDLESVNGGFMNVSLCPNCGEYAFWTVTFGVYTTCNECGYSDWFTEL